MKAIFLSDAHIRDHEDANLPPLLAFLDSLRGGVDRLYVVGDLFDTWFGFPRAVFDEYVPLLGALDRLHRSGVRIVYVTGNHDFEMGRFFTHTLQAEVHESEFTLESDGRRAYVAHGDMVNAADRKYRRLRRILRTRFTRWLGRSLPPSWVWRIAQQMSQEFTGEEIARRMPLVEIFDRFAREKLAGGFDTVILGHLHIPTLHRHDQRIYANLGEWMRLRTFLRWDDGQLSLWRWEWPAGKAVQMQAEERSCP